MGKKYRIIDEDGDRYEVEEVETEEAETPDTDEDPVKDDDSALSDEEIRALKNLASVADKLLSLVTEAQTTDEDTDEDEEMIEEDKEEIIDTDEEEDEDDKKPTCDSKKSFGAIEKPVKTIDSLGADLDIESAWAKRYGGNV